MRKITVSSRNAFSFLELMIVCIILGILATVAILQFSGPKEQALEKEVRSNLKLIAAAEKIYRLEAGGYYKADNETAINQVLRLMLPNDANKNWEYSVTAASGTAFTAEGTRTRGDKAGTKFRINQTTEEPYQ